MTIPHAHFGKVDSKLDWRRERTNSNDDDELRKPSHSITKLLKIDPLLLFESHKGQENFKNHLRDTKEESSLKSDFDSLKTKITNKIPEMSHAKKYALSPRMKKKGYHTAMTFSADKNMLSKQHAYHKTASGFHLNVGDNKIDFADLGVAPQHRKKGWGEHIVKQVSQTFPNHKIIVNDDSNGFWPEMIKKYKNLEKM